MQDAGIWRYEKEARANGYLCIAGVDEAGRGPIAGPVVAAAVMLPPDLDCEGIRDSKALTPEARQSAYQRIVEQARAVGVGVIGPEVIDEVNILQATYLAMRAALDDMGAACDFILLDGLPVPGLPADSLAIVDGDAKCVSISAASIVAKVRRDQIMVEMDSFYPDYGFASHKGYCTPEHLCALERWGPCAIHRRSFAPVLRQAQNEREGQCRLSGIGLV